MSLTITPLNIPKGKNIITSNIGIVRNVVGVI